MEILERTQSPALAGEHPNPFAEKCNKYKKL